MNEKTREFDRYGVIREILTDVRIPRMYRVRQHFDEDHIRDIDAAVEAQVGRADIERSVPPGGSIAITVGSRGVAEVAEITRALVAALKRRGAEPFIIPAMGSHGGATAEGQAELVAAYGVTEEYVDAPVRSTMETVQIGHTEDGKPVQIDRYAAEADGIVVVGRVKPHTAYRGPYESGLMKMMAIGLGKQRGAEVCHSEGFARMHHYVPLFGHGILAHANVLFGMAVIENAFHQVYQIEAVPAERIPGREPELLEVARSRMGRIHIPAFDVLVVDEIGKNHSGDGMDPNVIGRYGTPYATGGPEVQQYVVLDLSEETHGNFIGTGLADFMSKRVYDKLDFSATYPNILTSKVPAPAKLAAVMQDDWSAIAAGIFTCVAADRTNPRLVRIANTSNLRDILVSEALLQEVQANPELSVLEGPFELPFDSDGNLTDLRLGLG